MKLRDRLEEVSSVFVDSAPLIYFLEGNPAYQALMTEFFRLIREHGLVMVTSPVTLAECLVHPLRRGLANLVESYRRLIVEGEGTQFRPIGEREAALAARWRAEYGLALADALQAAVAASAGCQALLTNDRSLTKVVELRVFVLDDLEL